MQTRKITMKIGFAILSLASAMSFSAISNASSHFEQRCLEEQGTYTSGDTNGSQWEQCTFTSVQSDRTPKVIIPKAAKLCKEFSGQTASNSRRNWCTITHN
jgi:hypothetical protein